MYGILGCFNRIGSAINWCISDPNPVKSHPMDMSFQDIIDSWVKVISVRVVDKVESLQRVALLVPVVESIFSARHIAK